MLKMPREFSGFDIERQRRARVQRGALGAADGASPGLGLRRTPVNQVRFRIVAARDPHVAAGAERERQIAPRVAARLTGASDARRAPQLFPGVRIVTGDEAHIILVPFAPGDAGDDLAVDDDGAGRVLVAEGGIRHLCVPRDLAGSRVERDEMCAARRSEDFVAEDRDVLLGAAALPPRCRGSVAARTVLPDQIPGRRIERLHDVAWVGQVHDAVRHERRRLLRAIVHRPRPCHLKLLNVASIDLGERAVAPGVVSAPPVRPVPGRRVAEPFLGHGLKVRHLGWMRISHLRHEEQTRRPEGGRDHQTELSAHHCS